MNKVLLITGGDITHDFLKEYCDAYSFDYIIAVDGGLAKSEECGIVPNLILGDFDTIAPEIIARYEVGEGSAGGTSGANADANAEVNAGAGVKIGAGGTAICRLNPVKDATDTFEALEKAMELYDSNLEIHILGGVGSRIDHSYANLQLLAYGMERGAQVYILNQRNKIYVVGETHRIRKIDQYGEYVSLLPFGGSVQGVTLKGFKYPLENRDIDFIQDASLGVSNEIIEDEAIIHIKSGMLLVVEARD